MYMQELKELGLTENEAKVYLTLLREGAKNPTKIAQSTGLHRSYVYDTLERLIEKGIITTVYLKNKKHFQAVNPKVLRELYELKLQQLDTIIPELVATYKAAKEETQVAYHKGKRVYRTLIKDLTATIKGKETVLLIGVDEENLLSNIEPIYLRQYFTIIKQKQIKEKVIIKKGKKRAQIPNVIYKELDEKYIGETEQIIYGNKVAIFIPGEPYQLIIIESNIVADSYKKQFNLLWSIAK